MKAHHYAWLHTRLLSVLWLAFACARTYTHTQICNSNN